MQFGLTILVADADEETRLRLVEAITQVDPSAKVLEATNGRELARLLLEGPVDLVVIDVVLPQTNAADLLAWRGANPRGMIVLVSDVLAPGWPSVAKRIGAYDVMLKPLDERHIERILKASSVIRRKLRLLIVDASRPTRALVGRLLDQSHFSFDTVQAAGGREAVRLAGKRSFDLVILELNLPDFPALEVACLLNDQQPQAKVVVTGMEVDERLMRQFETFGIAGFLKKPFYFSDLDKSIHQVFGLWHPYLVAALAAEEQGAGGLSLAG